jgi:16S rRNA (cytidine1402-2'-O)-methyltransferase
MAEVFLIPITLHEDEESIQVMPAYIVDAVKKCQVFFVENERTARRYLKKIWKEMVIDDHQWVVIHKVEEQQLQQFVSTLKQNKNVGILSEAGCPGIADPGQLLVEAAQKNNFKVNPLVGPNSILLALMASGMNGQMFQFNGYLPIDSFEKKKTLKELEAHSKKTSCTHIFIETPYRNNAMLQDIIQSCDDDTLVCIAVDITGKNEMIQTKKARHWKNALPDLHKRPCIFLIQA